MAKLYEILSEIIDIGAEIHEAGELTPDLAEKLTASKLDLRDKMDSIAKLIKSWEAEAEMIKAEEQRLKARRESLESQAEGLMWYVKKHLPEGKPYKTQLHTFSWRRSEAIEIDRGAIVPEQYLTEKVSYSPNKELLTTDIKAGAKIPGIRLAERQNLSLK